MDKLSKSVKFELPPSLVESEAKQIAHELWHEKNPEVKDHNHDKIEPTKEHNKIAERRVKLGLFLSDLGAQNSIEVTDPEYQNALSEKMQDYPGQEKEFANYIEKNPHMKEQIKAPIFENKVVDFLLELCDVSEKNVKKEELKKLLDEIGKP